MEITHYLFCGLLNLGVPITHSLIHSISVPGTATGRGLSVKTTYYIYLYLTGCGSPQQNQTKQNPLRQEQIGNLVLLLI